MLRIEEDPGLAIGREEYMINERPFIAQRFVDFDGDNNTSRIQYLDEVMAGFGDARVSNPHATILTKTDTLAVHGSQDDTDDWLQTRDLIEDAIEHLELPETRRCRTGKADVFGENGSDYFVGFHLDEGGRKIINRERSKLLRRMGQTDAYRHYDGHVSLARTDDPLYARYTADQINAVVNGSLSITMSAVELSEPAVFAVRRPIPQGLPSEKDLSESIWQSFHGGVTTAGDYGHDLITATEGGRILRGDNRFGEVRTSLGTALGGLASMTVARIDGIETFESRRRGQDVDIVALTLDDRYSSEAREIRAKLFDVMGVERLDDDPASRLNIAAVRNRKLTPRVEKLVKRLIPSGRQVFLGDAVLRVYQNPNDYLV